MEVTETVTATATDELSLKHAVTATTTVVATATETGTETVTAVPVLKLVLVAPAVETIVDLVVATTTTADPEGTIAVVTDCTASVFGKELYGTSVHLSTCLSVCPSK